MILSYSLLESDIAKINMDLKNEYLIYGSYEKLILLYTTNICKYEQLTSNYYSLEMARMYYQCSYLIINTGDVNKFALAEEYLKKAIDIIENLYYSSKDYMNLYAQIYYLYSIIFEHRGNKDKALSICEDASFGIKRKRMNFMRPDVINRQIYLLSGDKDIIISINSTSKTTDLFEIFQNKRRLFQLYLRLHDLNKAKAVFQELNMIVTLLKDRLDKIYIGMYYRDLAKFFYMLNEKKECELYFRKAMFIFLHHGFNGQKKMILKENLEYGFQIQTEEKKDDKNGCYSPA